MVLKCFVRCQIKNVVAECKRFAVFFASCVFGAQKVCIRLSLLTLFLINNIVKQFFIFQRFAIFGEKAVGSRFFKTFSRIFFCQSVKFFISKRITVFIVTLFCFDIGACKILNLFNKFLRRVLILCVVIIFYA